MIRAAALPSPAQWVGPDDAARWLHSSLRRLADISTAHQAFPGAEVSIVGDPIGDVVRLYRRQWTEAQRQFFADALAIVPAEIGPVSTPIDHLIIRNVARLAGELHVTAFISAMQNDLFRPPFWQAVDRRGRETGLVVWNVVAGMLPTRAAAGLVDEAFSCTTLPADIAQLLYFAKLRSDHHLFGELTVRLVEKVGPDEVFRSKRFLLTLVATLGIPGLATYLHGLPYGALRRTPKIGSSCFGWLLCSLFMGGEALLQIRCVDYKWRIGISDKFSQEEADLRTESLVVNHFIRWLDDIFYYNRVNATKFVDFEIAGFSATALALYHTWQQDEVEA